MGAYNNDGVLLSPIYSMSSGQDSRWSKHVHDNVHGNIYLDPVLVLFHPILFTHFVLWNKVYGFCLFRYGFLTFYSSMDFDLFGLERLKLWNT